MPDLECGGGQAGGVRLLPMGGGAGAQRGRRRGLPPGDRDGLLLHRAGRRQGRPAEERPGGRAGWQHHPPATPLCIRSWAEQQRGPLKGWPTSAPVQQGHQALAPGVGHDCLPYQGAPPCAQEGGGCQPLPAAQERGNAVGQWWQDRLKRELGDAWVKVGLRQLSGLLCLVFGHVSLQVRRLKPAWAAAPHADRPPHSQLGRAAPWATHSLALPMSMAEVARACQPPGCRAGQLCSTAPLQALALHCTGSQRCAGPVAGDL